MEAILILELERQRQWAEMRDMGRDMRGGDSREAKEARFRLLPNVARAGDIGVLVRKGGERGGGGLSATGGRPVRGVILQGLQGSAHGVKETGF